MRRGREKKGGLIECEDEKSNTYGESRILRGEWQILEPDGGVRERERERERERNGEMSLVGNGMDAKYRQGCQVAETAAAPLSTGTG